MSRFVQDLDQIVLLSAPEGPVDEDWAREAAARGMKQRWTAIKAGEPKDDARRWEGVAPGVWERPFTDAEALSARLLYWPPPGEGEKGWSAETFDESKIRRDRMGRFTRNLDAYTDALENYMRALNIPGLHSVGGAVRDELYGKQPKDRDYIVVGMGTDEIERTLRPHGQVERLVVADRTVGVRFMPDAFPGESIEVVPPRKEVSTGPRYQDFDIVADATVPFEADALRRDFTINAIAKDEATGEIVDPLGGAQDLQERKLRVIGPESFRDDPLRILRGLRFISQLDLDPTEDTLEQMRLHASGVDHVSGERIQAELNKLLMGQRPAKALRIARDTGVLQHALPELTPAMGFDQQSKYHDLTLDEHIFQVVQNAADADQPLAVRLSALLHDAGKPESAWMGGDGRLHYYANPKMGKRSHEEIGAEIAVAALRRLKYDNETVDRVRRIVAGHMVKDHDSSRAFHILDDIVHPGVTARRFLAEHGDVAMDIIRHRRADIMAKDSDDGIDPKRADSLVRLAHFEAAVKKAHGYPHRIGDLAVDGNDLQEAGIPRGPLLGAVLKALLHDVLGQPSVNERDRLLNLARRHAQRLSAASG